VIGEEINVNNYKRQHKPNIKRDFLYYWLISLWNTVMFSYSYFMFVISK